MKLLPRWPLTPPLAAALLALLGGLAVPSAARASCGDYVMVGGHAAHEARPPPPPPPGPDRWRGRADDPAHGKARGRPTEGEETHER